MTYRSRFIAFVSEFLSYRTMAWCGRRSRAVLYSVLGERIGPETPASQWDCGHSIPVLTCRGESISGRARSWWRHWENFECTHDEWWYIMICVPCGAQFSECLSHMHRKIVSIKRRRKLAIENLSLVSYGIMPVFSKNPCLASFWPGWVSIPNFADDFLPF